ncbi:MAG TPA: hypothetical protein VHN99_10060 [Deinococcales bacterium]|nr:hypothetical protein [Deinococcales bacterium]
MNLEPRGPASGPVPGSFWARELRRGLAGMIVAVTVLLVGPTILVPLMPGRAGAAVGLSVLAGVVVYLAVSRGRDLLALSGWWALVFWLAFTSLLTGLASWAWR